MISIKNVTKIYKSKKGKDTIALNHISLQFDDKGLVFIVGKSGSGKSSLLNVIGGLDKYNYGEIIFDGKSFNEFKDKDYDYYRNSQVGFVFQDFNLLDTLTAYENIALALTICKINYGEINKRITNIADKLNIKDILNKYPYEMSGGQKQRVAAARAIITNPSLILADEPTGALDSKSAKVLLESMEKLNKDLNATIMMVTHDAFTASYADRILFIKDGKIFNELIKGNDSRNKFFDRIIDVITLLGGDVRDVC